MMHKSMFYRLARLSIASLVLGAYGQARLAPVLTPLFQSWGGMQPVAAQSAAAGVVLMVLQGLVQLGRALRGRY